MGVGVYVRIGSGVEVGVEPKVGVGTGVGSGVGVGSDVVGTGVGVKSELQSGVKLVIKSKIRLTLLMSFGLFKNGMSSTIRSLLMVDARQFGINKSTKVKVIQSKVEVLMI